MTVGSICASNTSGWLRNAAAGEANMEALKQIRTLHSDTTEECIGERHLWIAVVARALEDWRAGTLRERREAQRFLFDDDENFDRVCAGAGFDPASLRTQLSKLGPRITMEGPWSGSMAA
jgi:hypothetical protein